MADMEDEITWEGQRILEIPFDRLVLWTENPRDPMQGKLSNDEVIRHALSKEHEQEWQLGKLAKEMGDHYDMSELPTVCRLDGSSKYLVYDGNRRVILALLQKTGFPVEGDQFALPLFPRSAIPCNVCDRRTALEHVLRKHSSTGTWKSYERDLFMYRYMNGEKTVLIRMEELAGAISRWPDLNQRYVRDDVLNRKHLEEMGLSPDKNDYGIDHDLLVELLDTIHRKIASGELTTRDGRNDPVPKLPIDLIARIKENAGHHTPNEPENDETGPRGDDGWQPGLGVSYDDPDKGQDGRDESPSADAEEDSQENSTSRSRPRTRVTSPSSLPIFGPKKLSLRPGDTNNLYRTLESLWQMYEQGKMDNCIAFPAVFHMSLRLLAEQAAEECGMGLADYVKEYATEAKKELRRQEQSKRSKDITTFLSMQSVTPESLIMLLQNGAHAHTSTNNAEQARAISILLGTMLTISLGKE